MTISLPRAFARQAVDDAFVAALRGIVGRALEDRDVGAMTAKIFALHRDLAEAVRIIDNNLPG